MYIVVCIYVCVVLCTEDVKNRTPYTKCCVTHWHSYTKLYYCLSKCDCTQGLYTYVCTFPYSKCCACNMHVRPTLHAYMTVTLMLHACNISVYMTCMLH